MIPDQILYHYLVPQFGFQENLGMLVFKGLDGDTGSLSLCVKRASLQITQITFKAQMLSIRKP